MTDVEHREVLPDEAGMRLDRWIGRHFPGLAYGLIAKCIRTGQVRVDGSRAKTNARLDAGQTVRLPPAMKGQARAPEKYKKVGADDAAFIRDLVIYQDDHVMAINKPSGLAVQGGTKTLRHVDAMLEALRFGKPDRPRLVHRLDRDSSGILLLARSPGAAAALTRAFKAKTMRKVYWALCCGVPRPARGMIELSLEKKSAGSAQYGRELMQPTTAPTKQAKSAITYYATIAQAGRQVSWLALMPLTGRTHQLRAHSAAIGHSIVGDRKYGRDQARLNLGPVLEDKLYLHARFLGFTHPRGGQIKIVADLPRHMTAAWDFFEFDKESDGDPFAELEF